MKVYHLDHIEEVEYVDFQQLQRLCGGYVEMYPIGNDKVVICDEDGRLNEKPVNHLFAKDHPELVPFVGVVIEADASEVTR